ncbi:MAG: hypothetical protein ACRBF0_03350 [Calditrichia bacterium]
MGHFRKTLFWGSFLVTAMLFSCSQPGNRSPFEGIHWKPLGIECKVDGTWYRLDKIASVQTQDLISACKKQFGQSWTVTIEENFDAVLKLLNLSGNSVSVSLTSLGDSTSSIQIIPLLESNVDLVKQHRLVKEQTTFRAVPDSMPPAFWPVASTFSSSDSAAQRNKHWLSGEEISRDLASLEWLLNTHAVLLPDSLHQYREAIDALRYLGKDKLPKKDFYAELQLFISLCQDAGSQIRFEEGTITAKNAFSPFRIQQMNKRFVACTGVGNKLLSPQHPFVHQINTVPVNDWLQAADKIFGDNIQYLSRQSSATLDMSRINLVSQRFGVEPNQTVLLALESADGAHTLVQEFSAQSKLPVFSKNQILSELRSDSYAYISLSGLTSEARLTNLEKRVKVRNDDDVLVIDLRQTADIDIDIFADLISLLLSPESKPQLLAIEQYRCDEWRDANDKAGFNPNGSFHPLQSSHWNTAERKILMAIAAAQQPPADSAYFSDPHYLLATPKKASVGFSGTLIWLSDRATSPHASIALEAARELFSHSYHVGYDVSTQLGSEKSHQLPSGLTLKLTTSRWLKPDYSSFPTRIEPDRQVIYSLDHLLQDLDPTAAALEEFLIDLKRTAATY